MLKVTVLSAIDYDGVTFGPGVHEVAYEVAQSLYLRGSARPATQAEIAEANVRITNIGTGPVEAAVLSRRSDHALPPRLRTPRVRAGA